MITVQDVAEKAGVSVSTVSRVLNNSFMVTEDKRRQVLEAVASTGYVALRAKSAKQSRNKIILVVTSFLYTEMCECIRDAAFDSGYLVLFNFTGDSSAAYQNDTATLRVLRSNMVAGIIIINAIYKDPSLEVYFKDFPVVQIGDAYPHSPTYTVNIDDYQAGYDMTKYLLDKGYKTIGFAGVGGGLQHEKPDFSDNRFRGYVQALKDLGMNCEKDWVVYSDYSTEGGADAARKFVEMKKIPQAIFCVVDTIAVGCVNELKKLGFIIPNDVAVCGFDNSSLTEICTPNITSVSQSYSEIGFEAIQMLETLIHNGIGKGKRVFVSHKIIERESTGSVK